MWGLDKGGRVPPPLQREVFIPPLKSWPTQLDTPEVLMGPCLAEVLMGVPVKKLFTGAYEATRDLLSGIPPCNCLLPPLGSCHPSGSYHPPPELSGDDFLGEREVGNFSWGGWEVVLFSPFSKESLPNLSGGGFPSDFFPGDIFPLLLWG